MRKIALAILFVLGVTGASQAQFVNIPDSNFRNFLISQYPSCFNAGKQMDTSCAAVIGEDSLTVFNRQVKNLDGVQYFDNLKYLNCSANQLTNLPKLPTQLSNLYCYSNRLTTLPTLPSQLTTLYCNPNQLTTLPTLPAQLNRIDCSYN